MICFKTEKWAAEKLHDTVMANLAELDTELNQVDQSSQLARVLERKIREAELDCQILEARIQILNNAIALSRTTMFGVCIYTASQKLWGIICDNLTLEDILEHTPEQISSYVENGVEGIEWEHDLELSRIERAALAKAITPIVLNMWREFCEATL